MSVCALSLVVLLGALHAGDAESEEAGWRVGLARAKITPEKPFWMAGFAARKRPAEGTLQDLWVKVLALESGAGEVAVIVTADFLGMPKGMYDSLCRELKKRCGLDRSRLMFTASHTHSGPVLRDALHDIYPLDEAQRTRIEEYSSGLERTIISAVVEAMSRRTPATLWAAEGTVGFAVNRRTNRESELSRLTEQGVPPRGPSDHGVPVLAVRSGGLRAVVFGYAAHTSAMNLKEYPYHYSGDYAGFTQLELEKAYPGAQAMFFQGCGSDQSAAPRGTLERCMEMGGMLAAAVRDVLDKPMRPVAPRLSAALEFVRLDFEPATRDHLEKVAKEGGYAARWARRHLIELEKGEAPPTAYPEYPVQVWRLGAGQMWITLGGEVTVDYALKFKERYGPETWVCGYTNDVMAYIPSRRIWEEGGYQAGAFPVYGLPAVRWCPDIEERIMSCVDRLIRKVKR